MAFRPNWYDENPGGSPMGNILGGPIRSWTGIRLIVTTCVVFYLLELLLMSLTPQGQGLTLLYEGLGLRSWFLTIGPDGAPGHSFNYLFPVQLFTYMVLHDPTGLSHILWNMLLLWMFGRELEAIMGKAAFLRMFVAGGVFGGLLQWGYNLATGDTAPTIGASGAVYTVMVLYALRWPRRAIILFPFFLPVPAILLVGFKIVGDLMGFLGGGGYVAHLVHLGGAGMGFLWHLRGDVVGRAVMQAKRHKAQKVAESQAGDRREMDRILGKIQASGLSSLSAGERRFLEKRSKELRQER